jgi:hypothetical protein
MRETDFLHQFLSLLNADVPDMSLTQKTSLIHRIVDTITHAPQHSPGQHLPTCRIVPFVTGRRPIDEAAHPGLGSSDNTSMISTFPDPETNKTYILFGLPGIDQYTAEECETLALDVTLAFAGTDGQTLKVFSAKKVSSLPGNSLQIQTPESKRNL